MLPLPSSAALYVLIHVRDTAFLRTARSATQTSTPRVRSRGKIDGEVPTRHAGVVHEATVTHATPSLILLRAQPGAENAAAAARPLVVLSKLSKGVDPELDELRVEKEDDSK